MKIRIRAVLPLFAAGAIATAQEQVTSNYNPAMYVVIMLAATLTLAYAAVADFSGNGRDQRPAARSGAMTLLKIGPIGG